jgi:hypothetical protein
MEKYCIRSQGPKRTVVLQNEEDEEEEGEKEEEEKKKKKTRKRSRGTKKTSVTGTIKTLIGI